MERWRVAWRLLAPQLPREGLTALRAELTAGGPRLVRGNNVIVSPNAMTGEAEITRACPLGFVAWQGCGQLTREGVSDHVEHWIEWLTDHLPGNLRGSELLTWWDNPDRTPEVMRAELLGEVELALAGPPAD